jgi:FlaA1/EpsC-like NDP-sugar epimerase
MPRKKAGWLSSLGRWFGGRRGSGRQRIRETGCEDLLGRAAVELEESRIRSQLRGRVVLVTGAGGSIGSELCRQIARFRPAALIGVDQAETPLYQVEQEIGETFPEVEFHATLGNIQNERCLEEVFREHQPASVYHAAAYKHVPMMEAHVCEAVENNVFGTRRVAAAAARHGVEDFVLISSDKAVRPVSVLGATKRLAELVCLGAAPDARAGRKPDTKFMAVRFGNVLGSNGSVVRVFERQIARGGPVTVTHPEMQRFFMTVTEAAQLVLQAAAMGGGGEIFGLDMGDPIRILDLARAMIRSRGFDPGDIPIRFCGIRPGERIFEELCWGDEITLPTRHAHVRMFRGEAVAREALEQVLEALRRSADARDAAAAVFAMREIIPDYTPSAFAAAAERGARSVVA